MMTSTTQIFDTLAQRYLAAQACTPGTLQAHLQRNIGYIFDHDYNSSLYYQDK